MGPVQMNNMQTSHPPLKIGLLDFFIQKDELVLKPKKLEQKKNLKKMIIGKAWHTFFFLLMFKIGENSRNIFILI